MKIKNWIKDKYWLWGLVFGIIFIEIIGFYRYFSSTFPRWDYRLAFLNSPIYIAFFSLISELFFRTVKKFKKCPVNSFSRIIFLVLIILLSLLFITGMLTGAVWPFAD